MTAKHITMEIAVQSFADAQAALQGGADRLELCSCLELHGLTPSNGLIRQVRQIALPLVVMIRPRAGGFCYSQAELEQMEYEIADAIELGADGLAFGCLLERGALNVPACRRLLDACRGRTAVFHRAFDLIPDPDEALGQLRDMGITRVLTSGGHASATLAPARARIARLERQAGGTIEILPGGGIRAENVATLLAETGCTQIHAGCRTAGEPGSSAGAFEAVLGHPSTAFHTNPQLVRALRESLDACS